MSEKKFKSKLRSSETTKRRSEESMLSPDFSQIASQTIVHEQNRPICMGRGMAIKRMTQQSLESKMQLLSKDMDFSNSTIEKHFNQLRWENAKTLVQCREKII
ncbi:uncharacterized protein LOC126907887 isoform X2 [Daktulosphaira vitifoliae]|uniref:uncharacterized protein LOC126907887 isoform X2 n=1 Tax=Daktulosphaira vitifoliae TaxID=58002 RepID=UPI0021AA9497|nr:uncharacterized protein LOC126907887 isoform X2 [Daktulosphaira vitifoliae]